MPNKTRSGFDSVQFNQKLPTGDIQSIKVFVKPILDDPSIRPFATEQKMIKSGSIATLDDYPGVKFQTVDLLPGKHLKRFYNNPAIDVCKELVDLRCSNKDDMNVPPLYLTAGELTVYGKYVCSFTTTNTIKLMVLDYKIITALVLTLPMDLRDKMMNRFYAKTELGDDKDLNETLDALAMLQAKNRDILQDDNLLSQYVKAINAAPTSTPRNAMPAAWKPLEGLVKRTYIQSTGSLRSVRSIMEEDITLFNSLRQMVSKLGCAGIWSPPKNFHEEFIMFDCSGLMLNGQDGLNDGGSSKKDAAKPKPGASQKTNVGKASTKSTVKPLKPGGRAPTKSAAKPPKTG